MARCLQPSASTLDWVYTASSSSLTSEGHAPTPLWGDIVARIHIQKTSIHQDQMDASGIPTSPASQPFKSEPYRDNRYVSSYKSFTTLCLDASFHGLPLLSFRLGRCVYAVQAIHILANIFPNANGSTGHVTCSFIWSRWG